MVDDTRAARTSIGSGKLAAQDVSTLVVVQCEQSLGGTKGVVRATGTGTGTVDVAVAASESDNSGLLDDIAAMNLGSLKAFSKGSFEGMQ